MRPRPICERSDRPQGAYYDITVNGKLNKDAAWYYPTPKPEAAEITDRVAFWRGVQVTK